MANEEDAGVRGEVPEIVADGAPGEAADALLLTPGPDGEPAAAQGPATVPTVGPWPEDLPPSEDPRLRRRAATDGWPAPGSSEGQARRRRARTRHGASPLPLVVLGVAGLAVVALVVAALRGDGDAAGRRGVQELAIGDCLADPLNGQTEGEVGNVEAIACAEPHDAEVYAAFDLPETAGEAFPGEDTVFGLAETGCYERFEDFVGVPFQESALRFSTVSPTAATWGGGDRVVLCLVSAVDGTQLTGSVQGTEQ